jgi:predicted nucleic acid-binding protein
VVIQRQFPLDQWDQAALLAQDQDSEVDSVEGLMVEEVVEASGEDSKIVEVMVVAGEVLATKATGVSATEVVTAFLMLLRGLEVVDLVAAVVVEAASLVLQIAMVLA